MFRGKVLSFSFTEWGGFGVTFHHLPAVGRDDIVLPPGTLDAIERHTVGISRHADALRAPPVGISGAAYCCTARRAPARRCR